MLAPYRSLRICSVLAPCLHEKPLAAYVTVFMFMTTKERESVERRSVALFRQGFVLCFGGEGQEEQTEEVNQGGGAGGAAEAAQLGHQGAGKERPG